MIITPKGNHYPQLCSKSTLVNHINTQVKKSRFVINNLLVNQFCVEKESHQATNHSFVKLV